MEETPQSRPDAMPDGADRKTEKTPRPRRTNTRPRKSAASSKAASDSEQAPTPQKKPQLAIPAESIEPASLPAPLAPQALAVVEEKFFVPTLTNFSKSQNARPATQQATTPNTQQAGSPATAQEGKEGQSTKRRRRRGGRGRKKVQPSAETTMLTSGDTVALEAAAPLVGAVATQALALDPSHTEAATQAPVAERTEAKKKSSSRSRSRSKKSAAPLAADTALQTEQDDVLQQDSPVDGLVEEAQNPVQQDTSGRRPSRNNQKSPKNQEKTTEEKAAQQTQESADKTAKSAETQPAKRKLLVSVLPDEQVEVVVLADGQIVEYYVEMEHQAKIRGNIYKAVVSNIDANLQAAFINYGAGKNGFLQIDEVHPEYYLNPVKATKGHKYPPIQKVMKPGQEVLVQVGKEPTGNKGAFLTTWISLAGRFLVLTPGQEQIGISRKVEDEDERTRLREMIKGIVPGKDLGAIVRTVSSGATKTTLQKDLSFLKRLWKDIRKRGTQEKAPALIFQEPNLAARSVRDYFTEDVTEIWVDEPATAESMREMVGLIAPRKTDLVKLFDNPRKTLWEQFDVQRQIEQVHSREVHLPSGGRLVFDQTEALMAIDINSGKSGGKNNFESMAFKTNMEAARCIAQQLRMRDIGGQIVIDFIEMRDQNQVREVEKEMRLAMKMDRARHDVGKMSAFGLMQIVRQRTGSSAISISMESCPICMGTGVRRNLEWQAVQSLRDIYRKAREAAESGQSGLVYAVEQELALYLLNNKRQRLMALEQEFSMRIEVRPGRIL